MAINGTCGGDIATEQSVRLFEQYQAMNQIQPMASEAESHAGIAAAPTAQEQTIYRDPESVANVVDISV